MVVLGLAEGLSAGSLESQSMAWQVADGAQQHSAWDLGMLAHWTFTFIICSTVDDEEVHMNTIRASFGVPS